MKMGLLIKGKDLFKQGSNERFSLIPTGDAFKEDVRKMCNESYFSDISCSNSSRESTLEGASLCARNLSGSYARKCHK